MRSLADSKLLFKKRFSCFGGQITHSRGKGRFRRCLHRTSEAGWTSRGGKPHLGYGVNQRGRATRGFVECRTYRKPGKKKLTTGALALFTPKKRKTHPKRAYAPAHSSRPKLLWPWVTSPIKRSFTAANYKQKEKQNLKKEMGGLLNEDIETVVCSRYNF